MKRTRELEIAAETATYLMLLSGIGKIGSKTDDQSAKLKRYSSDPDPDRVFSCKTCNRQFASFQALGGHRASHKKPRLIGGEEALGRERSPASPVKAKTHECSICGLEFAIGQALGGHMRKHRNAAVLSESRSRSESLKASPDPAPVSVMKKSSSKRVLCMDLNLTPLENDLKLRLGFVL